MKCSRAHSWETAITHGLQHLCRAHALTRARAGTCTRATHLGHGVLNGRPREQQPVPTLKLKQDFPPDAEMGETISSREPREFKLFGFSF